MSSENEVLNRCVQRKKEWNKNQTSGNLRKSVFYDEIDAVLGCRDVVTLQHVLETGDSTTGTSSDGDSPLNLSTELSSSSSQGQECGPKEPVPTPKSCLEREKGKGKRKRNLEGDNDTERESQYVKQAVDGIKSQGERVVSCMEKMQEMQMQQMTFMNQFMGNFLQAFKDK